MEQFPETAGPQVTAADIRALCGDLLDWKVEAILALKPAMADIATAVAWANGQDDLGREGRPLEGVASQINHLLLSDETYDGRE